MKKYLKTIMYTAIGITAGGMISGGAYLIYKIMQDNRGDDEYVYDPKITMESQRLGIKITEDFSDNAYLGRDGINLLEKRVLDDLGFGPEISGLQSFNVVEGEFISDTDNGVYYEATKQIFINSKNLRKIVPESAPLEERVEAVFQILYHEYGHYISSAYLKNNKPNGTTPIAELYNDAGTKSTWDSYFVDKFKHYLGYDVNSSLYPFKSSTIQGKTWIPLASRFTTKNLFDLSNNKVKGSYGDLTNVYNGGTDRYNTLVPSNVKESSLRYLYSIDELYTRKYQQMGMVLNHDLNTNNGWFNPATPSASRMASPFLTDVFRYQSGLSPFYKKGYPATFDASHFRYFNDTPYGLDANGNSVGGNAPQLNQLMLEEMGQSNGSDISFIVGQNNSKMINNQKYQSYGNGRNIRFGGYFNQSDNYNYVGYMDGTKFVAFPIIKSEFKYGYKSALRSSTKNMASGETEFYFTKDYINAELIKGEALYFSDDELGTNKVAMISTRMSKVGQTSTYFYDSPSVLKTYYEVHNNKEGKIVIEGGSWT